MKTVLQVKDFVHNEQLEIRELVRVGFIKEARKRKKKLLMYREILLYLETKPKESTLLKTKEILKKTIKNIDDRFDYYVENVLLRTELLGTEKRKFKAIFNREHGVNKMKKQLQFINEILN